MGGIVAWDRVAVYFARALALLTAIPFHEAAHAWVADKLGDPTENCMGRLSLNPLRHLDPLARCACDLPGSAGKACARGGHCPLRPPAPAIWPSVPPRGLWQTFFWPMFTRCCTSWWATLRPPMRFWLFVFLVLSTMVNVNITLAVFNLLPVPPLDGSRIFNLLLPKRWYFAVMRYERIILLALFAVLFLGFFGRAAGLAVYGGRAPSGFCHRLCGACARALLH